MQQVDPMVYKLTINACYPAAFVWLETDLEGRFSDNGFIMTRQQVEVSILLQQGFYPV